MATNARNTNFGVSGDSSGIFSGVKFFIHRGCPHYSQLVQKVQRNGGEVARTDKFANIVIADGNRKDCPPNSLNLRYIDACLQEGLLIRRKSDFLNRPTVVQPKKSRARFTPQEDQILKDFVLSQAMQGNTSGNEIYKVFAIEHPTHSWQSWRDRWVKFLRLGLSSSERATFEKSTKIPFKSTPSPPRSQGREEETLFVSPHPVATSRSPVVQPPADNANCMSPTVSMLESLCKRENFQLYNTVLCKPDPAVLHGQLIDLSSLFLLAIKNHSSASQRDWVAITHQLGLNNSSSPSLIAAEEIHHLYNEHLSWFENAVKEFLEIDEKYLDQEIAANEDDTVQVANTAAVATDAADIAATVDRGDRIYFGPHVVEDSQRPDSPEQCPNSSRPQHTSARAFPHNPRKRTFVDTVEAQSRHVTYEPESDVELDKLECDYSQSSALPDENSCMLPQPRHNSSQTQNDLATTVAAGRGTNHSVTRHPAHELPDSEEDDVVESQAQSARVANVPMTSMELGRSGQQVESPSTASLSHQSIIAVPANPQPPVHQRDGTEESGVAMHNRQPQIPSANDSFGKESRKDVNFGHENGAGGSTQRWSAKTEATIAPFIKLGHSREDVVKALRATSFDIALVSPVLTALQKDGKLPEDVPGVWTCDDDDALRSAADTDAAVKAGRPVSQEEAREARAAKKRLLKKHGKEALLVRSKLWRFCWKKE